MKKILQIFVLFSLLSILPLSVNAAQTPEMATVVVNEDFENYRKGAAPEDGWDYDSYDKSLGIYAEVESDPLNSNNKCLKYVRKAGNIVYAHRYFEPIGGKAYIEYKFMVEDMPGEVLYVGILPGIYNLMTFQGAYAFANDGAVANIAPTPNVWHTFFLEMDFIEKCFNAYIDGNLVREEQSFGKKMLRMR